MGAIDRRRRRPRLGVVAAGVGAAASVSARASDNSLDVRFLHYGESDNRTQVENPEIYMQFGFGEKGRIGVLLSYDSISGASPTGAGPAADTTTSASGGSSVGPIPTANYSDTRQAVTLSYSTRFGAHLPSVALSYSHESDYLSRGVSLVDSWEFVDGRSTFHYGVGGTSDVIEPGNSTNSFSKRSVSVGAGWTHIVGPRDLFDISASYDRFRGYLTDPYKVVPVTTAAGTVNVPEARPESRARKALIFKYGHYFLSRTALKTSYRYYWDDWSLNAHTLDLSVDQRVGHAWVLTPRLRYYRQGSASFFAYEFPSAQEFMSSDYRLSSFWSWLAGLGFTVAASDQVSLNLAATYTDQRGIDRISSGVAAAPAPVSQRLRRVRTGLGEGDGDDDGDDDGGEGGPSSVSPADVKTFTLTAGFSIRF